MNELFGPLDFLPPHVTRGEVRVHPTRAAERANDRLAPLVAALEQLDTDDDDLDGLLERVEAVVTEYRKLRERG